MVSTFPPFFPKQGPQNTQKTRKEKEKLRLAPFNKVYTRRFEALTHQVVSLTLLIAAITNRLAAQTNLLT